MEITKRIKVSNTYDDTIIPVDCWFEIFVLLPPQDITTVAACCKRFAKICYSDQLWKQLCTKRWPNEEVLLVACLTHLSLSFILPQITWVFILVGFVMEKRFAC